MHWITLNQSSGNYAKLCVPHSNQSLPRYVDHSIQQLRGTFGHNTGLPTFGSGIGIRTRKTVILSHICIPLPSYRHIKGLNPYFVLCTWYSSPKINSSTSVIISTPYIRFIRTLNLRLFGPLLYHLSYTNICILCITACLP